MKHLRKKSGKRCQLSGKSAMKGWHYSFLRSHFNRTAKRKFFPNLRIVTIIDENGIRRKIKVCTSVIKSCPELRLGVSKYRKKAKRLKGKHKKELFTDLGLIEREA